MIRQTKKQEDSFKIQGPTVYNYFPDELEAVKSKKNLKNMLKSHLNMISFTKEITFTGKKTLNIFEKISKYLLIIHFDIPSYFYLDTIFKSYCSYFLLLNRHSFSPLILALAFFVAFLILQDSLYLG